MAPLAQVQERKQDSGSTDDGYDLPHENRYVCSLVYDGQKTGSGTPQMAI